MAWKRPGVRIPLAPPRSLVNPDSGRGFRVWGPVIRTTKGTPMATPHIAAEPGQVAPLVLMPGDPKRAARIAAEHLEGAELVSDVRGIGCWTGSWQGTPMSVMANANINKGM